MFSFRRGGNSTAAERCLCQDEGKQRADRDTRAGIVAAWASTLGDTTTELELPPSGKYKPVSRFASFVNVTELISMFQSFADVVMPADLREYVKVPAVSTG